MRKLFLCLLFVLIFLQLFTKDALGYTKCFVNGVEIGDMHHFSYGNDYNYATSWTNPSFIVRGGFGLVEFAPKSGVVVNNDVQFRPGNGSWISYSEIRSSSYFLTFTVPNDSNCGNWYTNVKFRYSLDNQYHYCDDLTNVYSSGLYVNNFLNSSCLTSPSKCVATDSNAKQASYTYYDICTTLPSGESCSNHQFCTDTGLSTGCKSLVKTGYPEEYDCDCELYHSPSTTYSAFPVLGYLKGYMKFLQPSTAETSVWGSAVQLYNFISNSYCGVCLTCVAPTSTPTPIPPTPTPTIEYSYCETGLCKIRYTSPGLTACKGVVNGCFCYNVNCNNGLDCVTQTGANTCDVCNAVTHKCEFAAGVPTPTPTSIPTPTPACATYYWQVEADNGNQTRLSALRSFDVCEGANRWFQTKDGDVHANTDINCQIPSTVINNKYVSLAGEGGSPGVVSYGNSLTLGSGTVSEINWQAKAVYNGPDIGFEYLKNRLNVSTGSDTFNGTMPSVDGIYYSSSAKDLSGSFPSSFPSGKKIIIFVNGNVTVQNDIIVPEGSFFALISSGDISFATTVTGAEGFFLADGTILTGVSSEQFVGQGSFIGKTGVSLQRDLGAANDTPAEYFIGRSDLFLNTPTEFLVTPSFFQELAP